MSSGHTHLIPVDRGFADALGGLASLSRPQPTALPTLFCPGRPFSWGLKAGFAFGVPRGSAMSCTDYDWDSGMCSVTAWTRQIAGAGAPSGHRSALGDPSAAHPPKLFFLEVPLTAGVPGAGVWSGSCRALSESTGWPAGLGDVAALISLTSKVTVKQDGCSRELSPDAQIPNSVHSSLAPDSGPCPLNVPGHNLEPAA